MVIKCTNYRYSKSFHCESGIKTCELVFIAIILFFLCNMSLYLFILSRSSVRNGKDLNLEFQQRIRAIIFSVNILVCQCYHCRFCYQFVNY